MKLLSIVGNSLGCSASGERLVSAARDGDLQEAKALLAYNPRLARYSTFGVRNSPLHFSAAQGHHEIVSILTESGVDINLRNYRGQTALMQACQHGHWEVVLILILFKANIHKTDYLNGGTALHLAALNGHARCIRLLLADYVPSIPNFWSLENKSDDDFISEFDKSALSDVINRRADVGLTALHMAALNGHVEVVQLLLDLGASVSEVTVDDGSTIDLIGPGSTPLHYAASGGNAQCCQILMAKGASVTAENANGCTPLMVARSWNRRCLEEVLTVEPEVKLQVLPSPHLCLPLMSIVKIARDYGWRSSESALESYDPCAVCMENKCTVAAEGCVHEFCIRCALYLCSTTNSSTCIRGNSGSIPCPLCRQGIVSFFKLPEEKPLYKDSIRTSLSLSLCTWSNEDSDSISITTPFCKRTDGSFHSRTCRMFPSFRINLSRCMADPDISRSLIPRRSGNTTRDQRARRSRSFLRRSTSVTENRKSWFCVLNNKKSVTTGSEC